ncbi:MAG: sugar ABC transporter permease, partial [Actinobacteria bacterium]|nr:sugar ABC transporter permease [Actinomycetota bacterium]
MSTQTITKGAGAAQAAPGSRGESAPRPRKHGRLRKDGWWALLFVGPLLFGVLVFYIWPIFRNAYFSFTTWGAFGGATWSGISNYQQMLADPDFWRSILNTLIYV